MPVQRLPVRRLCLKNNLKMAFRPGWPSLHHHSHPCQRWIGVCQSGLSLCCTTTLTVFLLLRCHCLHPLQYLCFYPILCRYLRLLLYWHPCLCHRNLPRWPCLCVLPMRRMKAMLICPR